MRIDLRIHTCYYEFDARGSVKLHRRLNWAVAMVTLMNESSCIGETRIQK